MKVFRCSWNTKTKTAFVFSIFTTAVCLYAVANENGFDKPVAMDGLLFLLRSDTSPVSFRGYCQSGRQIRKVTDSFLAKIPKEPPGTPKDVALKHRDKNLSEIREIAGQHFQHQNSPMMTGLIDNYTMFIPLELQRKLNGVSKEWWTDRRVTNFGYKIIGRCVNEDCAMAPSPTKALDDREKLWEWYISKFTSSKESLSDEPDTLKFQTTLDLEVFCKYARPIEDLVTVTKPSDADQKRIKELEARIHKAYQQTSDEEHSEESREPASEHSHEDCNRQGSGCEDER